MCVLNIEIAESRSQANLAFVNTVLATSMIELTEEFRM